MLSLNVRSVFPFLKYPGGKRRLLPAYDSHFPRTLHGRYFEPMVGGGSLPLIWEGRWRGGISVCDANIDVVTTYEGVQSDPYGVAHRLSLLIKCYNLQDDKRAMYHAIRDDFNAGARTPENFIFLNQAGFNGLVRYNKSGNINTPWGHKPALSDTVSERVLRAGRLLSHRFVDIVPAGDFSWVEACAVQGDLVYFDPPYLSPKGFTQYWKDDFSLQAHIKLRDLARRLSDRGVLVRVANSDNPQVRELYSGFRIVSMVAPRPINRDKSGRGVVPEVLIKEPDGPATW